MSYLNKGLLAQRGVCHGPESGEVTCTLRRGSGGDLGSRGRQARPARGPHPPAHGRGPPPSVTRGTRAALCGRSRPLSQRRTSRLRDHADRYFWVYLCVRLLRRESSNRRWGAGVCLKGRALWGQTRSGYTAGEARCKIGWGAVTGGWKRGWRWYWGCRRAFQRR